MNRKSFLAMLGGVFAALIAKLPRAAKVNRESLMIDSHETVYVSEWDGHDLNLRVYSDGRLAEIWRNGQLIATALNA